MTLSGEAEVDALVGALTEHGIRLSLGAPEEVLQFESWCRIELAAPGDLTVSIAVDDEYGDATEDNQAILLHLVLASCECYEEGEDLLEWAREAGMDVSKEWVRELYDQLRDVVPRIREVVGSDVRAISSWDFNLNAGAARTLRERSTRDARDPLR
jgi:hypothetical protein